MQTAGRIDQDNIGLSSFGRGNPVVGHCRRIRAMPMADHLDTDPIGPDLKLVNRGGTKGIGRDEHRDALTLDQSLRELGLFSLIIPEEFGGLELSNAAYARVLAQTSSYDSSVSLTRYDLVGKRSFRGAGTLSKGHVHSSCSEDHPGWVTLRHPAFREHRLGNREETRAW